jgi:uncharacterized RDD family membrane protein YckC
MTTTEPLIEDAPNPTAALSGDEAVELEPAPPVPASLGRRFGNFVLDFTALGVLETTLGSLTEALELQVDIELGELVLALMSCYVLPEWLFGRTLGKLVTGTKVVSLDRGRPSFLRIVSRTLVRFVPFEPFSFVFGDLTGWHDDWSRTRVVQSRDPYAAMVRRM